MKAALALTIAMFFVAGCGKGGQKWQSHEGKFSYLGELAEADRTFFADFYGNVGKYVGEKNSSKMLSFFSKAFVGQQGESLTQVQKNLPAAYNQVKSMAYDVSQVRLTVEGPKNLIAEHVFRTTITQADSQVEKSQGKERLYWRKEANQWKILHWETNP